MLHRQCWSLESWINHWTQNMTCEPILYPRPPGIVTWTHLLLKSIRNASNNLFYALCHQGCWHTPSFNKINRDYGSNPFFYPYTRRYAENTFFSTLNHLGFWHLSLLCPRIPLREEGVQFQVDAMSIRLWEKD